MFAHLKVGGVSVVDLNKEWLGKYDVAEEEIDDLAEELVPGLDKENLSEAELEDAIHKNHEMQELAERLITLLDRLSNEGCILKESSL